MTATGEKYGSLLRWFRELGSCAVMFSGGVDSAFLLAAAVEALGEDALAVTGRSALHPAAELEDATRIARMLGARHVVVETREMEDPAFTANPPERCGLCKAGIARMAWEVARREGVGAVVDGNNADDVGDYRPGMAAARAAGVRSPLLELGFAKAEIRELSRKLGLPDWDKPAAACLASRIPYGEEITAKRLARIERAERALGQMGLGQLRVRDHGSVARIELEPERIDIAADRDRRAAIVEAVVSAGYRYAALDLAGYRMGSLNEGLDRGDGEP